MRKILISGYYGFANAGDEAMLSAIISSLRAKYDNLEIVVISGNPAATTKAYNIKAIARFNMLQIMRELISSDLLISGGGSLLQDITSERSLFYYLSIIQTAKMLGKKVMLYGQGIGPLRGNLARQLTGFVCRQADRVTVRDEGSAQELISLGVTPSKIVVTADPVFAMQPVATQEGMRILTEHGVVQDKKIIGISARQWQGLHNYKQVLASTADEIVAKYNAQIVFLPLHYPQDIKVSQEIADLMHSEHKLVLGNVYNTKEFLSLIGNFDLLIGVRLHALIFAAVMQVPIIGISYDPKIDRFLEGVQAKAVGCLNTLEGQVLMDKIDYIMSNMDSERLQQNACVHKLRDAAEENARLAIELLN